MLAGKPKLGLRTKFLLSLVVITVGLSCSTLLFVRHYSREHVQQEIAISAHNSVLTFQALLHQREVALNRKADLLATLATVTDSGDSTPEDSILDDSADGALQTDGSDLVVLADPTNKITDLHANNSGFTAAAAEGLLGRSLAKGTASDWWYVAGSLYQVVLQPINRHPLEGEKSGTLVVGSEIDYAAVHDLGRISSGQLAFSYGGNVVASTLSPLAESELASRLKDLSAPGALWIGKQRFFANSVDLTVGSGPTARLTVLKSYNDATAFLSRLNHLLTGLGFLALVVGTGLAIFISDTFTRPLARLNEGVRALERGDFAFPLEAQGGDEVAHVTRAFDQMRGTLRKNEAQKQQLEDQLRQSQKMEALGRLAGGVAHDFNNLLTVIKGHSELMLERINPSDPLSGSGQQIRKAADRAASLTRQMLAFSRRQALQPTVFELNAVVADMCTLLKRLIPENVEFTLQPSESALRAMADTGQIEQVVLNLAINACDAMPNGGRLVIQTRSMAVDADYARSRPTLDPGPYVVLTVTDTGHGMDDETKARIFEPFFTTKGKGKGTGLGLATVYGVVKQSGGFVWVATAPGKGTSFEVYFPQVAKEAEPVRVEEMPVPRAAESKTVLLAEDEPEVRSLAREFLISAGYRVLAASDGEKALEIAKAAGEPIHLLLTDVVMPRMGGPELAKRLRLLCPELKVIYMSGYLEQSESGASLVEDSLFLQKPFSRDALVRQVSVPFNTACSREPAIQTA